MQPDMPFTSKFAEFDLFDIVLFLQSGHLLGSNSDYFVLKCVLFLYCLLLYFKPIFYKLSKHFRGIPDLWIWLYLRFASVTVNLGPTFLSGALAANAGAVMDEPSCPLVQVNTESEIVWIIDLTQGPYRHYVLNAIWILINLLCIMLTIYHLRKLYRDFTKSNIEALRVHRLFSSAIRDEKHQVINNLLADTFIVL